MSDFIPEELMVNIWIRLPIRSAVRFRCVSKSWRASLSDPDLISKNLTFSDPKNDHHHDLLVFVNHFQYYVVSYETLQVSPLHVIPHEFGSHIVLSSCDGLICYHEIDEEYIAVWNPATGETKTAPALPHIDGDFVDFQTIGFGFDWKNNDYKIVKILAVWNPEKEMEAFVYSLRSDCWRKLDEPNISATHFYPKTTYNHFPSLQAHKDGTFYWYADNFIVSFDMSDEVFKSIHIPKDPSRYIDSFFWFKDRSLGIATHNEDEFQKEKSVFQIWALLDAGVAQSWTHLLTIDDSWVTGLYQSFGFWRNEYIFRTCSDQLIMCDPFKRETKAINIAKYLQEGQCCVVPYIASRKPLSLPPLFDLKTDA